MQDSNTLLKRVGWVVLFLCFLLGGTGVIQAQKVRYFKNSAGAGAYLYKFRNHQELLYALNYSPQFNFIESRYFPFAISAGSQVSLGYHTNTGNDTTRFFYGSLPLYIEMNLYHFATTNGVEYAGICLGGGYELVYFHKKISSGVPVTACVRFWLFRRSFAIRASHFFSVESSMFDYSSLTLNMNFGSFVRSIKENTKVSKASRPWLK